MIVCFIIIIFLYTSVAYYIRQLQQVRTRIILMNGRNNNNNILNTIYLHYYNTRQGISSAAATRAHLCEDMFLSETVISD